jgi:hypothetical protein
MLPIVEALGGTHWRDENMAVKIAADALKRWQAAMSSGTARQNYIDGINYYRQPDGRGGDPGRHAEVSGQRPGEHHERPARTQAHGGLRRGLEDKRVNFGASKLADAAKKGGRSTRHGHNRRRARGSKCRTLPRVRGTMEKIRAALNVQLAAAGKPTI